MAEDGRKFGLLPVNFGCFPVVILVLSCCVLVWCHYSWNGRALRETWFPGIFWWSWEWSG